MSEPGSRLLLGFLNGLPSAGADILDESVDGGFGRGCAGGRRRRGFIARLRPETLQRPVGLGLELADVEALRLIDDLAHFAFDLALERLCARADAADDSPFAGTRP